jgi:hypothetical protein
MPHDRRAVPDTSVVTGAPLLAVSRWKRDTISVTAACMVPSAEIIADTDKKWDASNQMPAR